MKMMKPQWLRDIRRFVQYCRIRLLDSWRYMRHSSFLFGRTRAPALGSTLTILAHKIEKGMALPRPRLGFGQDTLQEILYVHERLESLVTTSPALAFSLGVVSTYVNSEHITYAKPELAAALYRFVEERRHYALAGGMRSVRRAEVLRTIPANIEAFFYSRYSVRNFSDAPVKREELMAAVRLAQRSPSVCNRQPWRIYVVTSETKKKEILMFQNGNSGFGSSAGAVLVVTAPLDEFHSALERNEAFVDGGMFSMSLIWALHAKGLGSCALNWCASHKNDKRLRAALRIPHEEVVIMMVAVGHLKDQFHVAMSPRRPAVDVVAAWIDEEAE